MSIPSKQIETNNYAEDIYTSEENKNGGSSAQKVMHRDQRRDLNSTVICTAI
jgi:hypothetical protein